MSVAAFDNLNLLLQIQQTTRNLAQSMRNNASTHLSYLSGHLDGSAGSPTLPVIAQFMNDCAASYLNIIATASAWVAANQPQTTAALSLIGATMADLQSYTNPLKTAAQTLQSADKSTLANAQAACNALISAVGAPASVFGN